MSVEPLRFGIMGCGVIGPTHAAAIASLPEARLVAVADAVPERARTMAEEYGVKAYSNLQAMLDSEALDVVNVCTPSGQHGEHACAAMRSGRNVIVEKPMEITAEKLDEILRVQEEAGVKLSVISQHRFDPATVQVYNRIEGGELGRLVLGNAHIPWWRSQAYYDSGAWRGTWALDGGGVLMNQAIHSIDLLQWLMGAVRSVYAYTDTLVHRMETEDVAVAVLRFESGALGTIAATTGAYPGLATRIEVFGDRGSAVIADDNLALLHLASEDHEEAGPYGLNATGPTEAKGPGGGAARDPSALSVSTHALQIADMVRAIRDNRTPLVDGYAGRQPVDIILAIYESARMGLEVRLR